MSAKDNTAVEMAAVEMTAVEKAEAEKTESQMKNRSMVLWAILSLSMANALVGTGISPALGVIRQSFPDAPGVLVQMIVSLPSLMVIAVAIPFAWLSRRYSVRKLCAAGLVLFLAGGLMGGLASGIYTLVLTRILIGAGYGLMMPLSVGLLSYFFTREEQHRLNGGIVIWSSVSSIICMVLAGYLAAISWRAVFLVYLFGIPCLWLCLKHIPDVTVTGAGGAAGDDRARRARGNLGVIRKTWVYGAGTFVVFVGYFAILNNCSSIILSEGLISGEKVGIIMSFQTVSSLVTGLYIGKLKKLLGRYMGTFIWLCSIGGLLSLYAKNSLALTMLGLVLFGIALASAVGTFNAEACIACERDESLAAGSVIMFMRSLGQFSSPLVLEFMARTAGASDIRFPYEGAALLSVVMMGVFWVNGLVRSSLKKQAAC